MRLLAPRRHGHDPGPEHADADGDPYELAYGGDEAPEPGQFLVATAADLIITSELETDPAPAPKAFRLSDGSPLPAPRLAAFPLALSPDGTEALIGCART